MIEYHEGAGAGHVANKSQTDKLVLWTPATWKFTRRALDGQGCGTGGGQRICHKAPMGRAG